MANIQDMYSLCISCIFAMANWGFINRYDAIYESTDVAFVMLTTDTNKTSKDLNILQKGKW
jgi:hypothetical protein